MGDHAVLQTMVWLEEQEVPNRTKYLQPMEEIRVSCTGSEEKNLFCGILCSSRAKLVQGRVAVDLQVYSSSCKLDLKRKNRSFQDEQRSRGNLFSLLLKEYQGDFIWDQPGREGAVGKFLMQYQETDWEFLKRVASQKGYLLSPEIHFPGIRVCVGLPKYQIRKTLPDRNCCIRNRMSGRWEYQMPGGMISFPEYVVEGVFEDFQIGEAVQFLELPLIGAAVQGTVTETTPTMSRLMLKTDGSGEKIRSWHHQPVYYSGSGKGYSGRPEKGDTQYVYFPTMEENDRYIIGGAGSSFQQISDMTEGIVSGIEKEDSRAETGTPGEAARREKLSIPPERSDTGRVTKDNAPENKSWSTPEKQSVSLAGKEIRLATGKGDALNMTRLGIMFSGKGNITVTGSEIALSGTKVNLQAKDYISIKCGGSALAMLSDVIHIKGTDVKIESSYNPEILLEAYSIDDILDQVEACKKQFLPVFASDGTLIRREKYDEIIQSEELFNYFMENFYGKGDYENSIGQPVLTIYDSWLSNFYGRTTAQKIDDFIFSLDGLQMTLDVAGFVFPPADLVNCVISMCRGNYVGAALDAIGALPLLGDLIKGAYKTVRRADSVISGFKFTYKAIDTVDDLSDGVKTTLNSLDALGVKTVSEIADTSDDMKTLINGTDAIKRIEGISDGADAMGDAGQAAAAAVRTTDMAETAGNAEKTLEQLESTKYSYHDKPVSSDVEVKCDVIDNNANIDIVGDLKISKSKLKHINNRHNPNTYAAQLLHKPKIVALKELENKTFFNVKWSKSQIEEAVYAGYNEAIRRGISDGNYTFVYNGENITVALKNGLVETAFGDCRYSYEQLLELLE